MKRRHEITVQNISDQETTAVLASSSSDRGHKRLTMFVNPATASVRFVVSDNGLVTFHETAGEAVAAYNAISV